MKKSALSLAIVLVLSASTSTMFAAVAGTNPRPQAVDAPTSDYSAVMDAMMMYFGF